MITNLRIDFEDFKQWLEEHQNPLLAEYDSPVDNDLVVQKLIDREEEFQKWVNITDFILGKLILSNLKLSEITKLKAVFILFV